MEFKHLKWSGQAAKKPEGERKRAGISFMSHMDAKLREFSSPSAGDISIPLCLLSPLCFLPFFTSFIAGLLSPARLIYSGSEQNGLGPCNLQ